MIIFSSHHLQKSVNKKRNDRIDSLLSIVGMRACISPSSLSNTYFAPTHRNIVSKDLFIFMNILKPLDIMMLIFCTQLPK